MRSCLLARRRRDVNGCRQRLGSTVSRSEMRRQECYDRPVEPLLKGLPVETGRVDAGHFPDARVRLFERARAGRAECDVTRRLDDMRLRRWLQRSGELCDIGVLRHAHVLRRAPELDGNIEIRHLVRIEPEAETG